MPPKGCDLMSQHSSLKTASVGARHRNVLKRHERIRELQKNEKWGDRQSVFKLPKLKLIKLKIKKAKSAKEGETPAEGGAQAAAPQAQAQAPAAQKPAPEKSKGREKA